MASLRKLPNSIYWIACYTDHTSRQRQRSTKQTDRKKAQKIADQYESAYKRTLTESQARRVLSDIYKDIHGEHLLKVSIEDYFKSWLSRKEIENARSTYLHYQGTVKKFLTFLGPEKSSRDLSYLSKTEIVNFRDNVAEDLTAATANQHLKILRSALHQAWKDELMQDNPAARVATIKKIVRSTTRRGFTISELKKVLAAANEEWRGIIIAGLYTGQRLGDIARLTWASIDLQREELALTTAKTGRRIVLPIAQPLMDYLLRLPASDKPSSALFKRAYEKAERHGNVVGLSQQFYDLLVSAGLAKARSYKSPSCGKSVRRKTNELSFHSLRHTATTLMKDAGIPESVVRDVIGHASSAVSAIYTHVGTNAKRKALNALPNVFEE